MQDVQRHYDLPNDPTSLIGIDAVHPTENEGMRSLCTTCGSMREIVTPKGIRFLLCRLSQFEAGYPKYPRQPVVTCDGFRPRPTTERTKEELSMLPLYEDPWFTFRFADDRIVPRFRLEGVESGSRVAVHGIDADTGERTELRAVAILGDDGWVDLPEPLVVRVGEAFVVVPT